MREASLNHDSNSIPNDFRSSRIRFQQFLISQRSTALLDLVADTPGQLRPQLLFHPFGHGSDIGSVIALCRKFDRSADNSSYRA